MSIPGGSPPRLWGMHIPPRRKAIADRFTPTPVGNACPPSTFLSSAIGSPPRLWGMLHHAVNFRPLVRFTPTPVGNAATSSAIMRVLTVHPHACGECRHTMDDQEYSPGSPPRLWGMRADYLSCFTNGRFTPTPVGNACCRRVRTTMRPVHPHACGECRFDHWRGAQLDGSPPRLWGMLLLQFADRHVVRFTPTPVGNAIPAAFNAANVSVHPHACGECLIARVARDMAIGSPPRLWGMPEYDANMDWLTRFTPTPVGNAHSPDQSTAHSSVHPHACGECSPLIVRFVVAIGSPPRLWGMLLAVDILRPRIRFTPTPVGNAGSPW